MWHRAHHKTPSHPVHHLSFCFVEVKRFPYGERRWWEKSVTLKKVIDTHWPWPLTLRTTPLGEREKRHIIWHRMLLKTIIPQQFVIYILDLFYLPLNACCVYFRLSKVVQNQYLILQYVCFLLVFFLVEDCNRCGSIFSCATKVFGIEKKFLQICSLLKFLVLWQPLFTFIIYSCCCFALLRGTA